MAMVFSAERPRKWPSGQNETNRGTKSRHQIEVKTLKEYPRNLGNPPLPRARVRARFIGEKLEIFARTRKKSEDPLAARRLC